MLNFLFSPIDEQAPFFGSRVFMLGMSGVSLGMFSLFEYLSRGLRAQAAQHPQGWFRICGIPVSPETFETFLQGAAKLGRTTAKAGFVLVISAFAVSLWRG
ncbi:MAG: hypothetical protein JXQ89_22335 [Pelagimonas sp.]